ncbi:MAG: DEAD/DEAH box helicase [Cetobacterium sp.]
MNIKMPTLSVADIMAKSELNEMQKEAFDAALKYQNIFITGLAGSGKSFLVKKIKIALESKQKYTAVTSLTGISANLIGGMTLHSFLGIQLGTGSFKKLFKLISANKKILARWRYIDALIIDEVSMLSVELFEKLEKLARALRCDEKAFGGIQIILTGDFCQLAPVGQDEFIFESKIWNSVIHKVIYLTKIMRQSDDKFVGVLNKIRLEEIDNEVIELLESRQIKYISDTGLIPSMIYATNNEVDKTNKKYYDRLDSEEFSFKMAYKWNPKIIYKEKYLSLVRFKEVLSLKIGAQVMYLVNQNGLFNGSRGVVKNFINGYPLVLFLSGIELLITNSSLDIEEQDTKIMTYTQLPLKLAFACSCHSQQGSTLDLIRVDFNKFFACGQAYVALSRVKSIDGLFIRNFNENLIKCHPKAKKFYKDLEQLHSEKDLE